MAYYIGLMSGTSMDGVDAVLAGFSPCVVHHHVHRPFDAELRGQLLELQNVGSNELDRAATLAIAISKRYAEAVERLLRQSHIASSAVTAIGCHGQTVRHRPERGYTLQLVDAALLAELSQIDVIADFRRRDLAAGGQGAPLVPAFHAALFAAPDADRVVVNIGGIANVTLLPRTGVVSGFDTGPGNMLMDAWCERHHGAAFDRDGNWAASGKVNANLLQRLSQEPYLQLPPPKSTGRDLWNMAWLESRLKEEAATDVQATLLELTARTIAQAIATQAPANSEVYVCGGGANNRQLMAALQSHLPNRVQSTAALGLPVDQVEATAFAWLAQQWTLRQPGNLPAVTGARHPVILGALYPH